MHGGCQLWRIGISHGLTLTKLFLLDLRLGVELMFG